MLVSEAVARIKAEGGADAASSATPDATIRGWVNDSVKDAIARSRWRKVKRELGPTVAGQAQYALADDVVDVAGLRLNGSTAVRVSTQDVWELGSGTRALSGASVAFAPAFEEDADSTIEVWPAPESAGYTIEALCAVLPAELEDADSIPLPADLVRDIAVGGPVAHMLLFVEEDAAAAQPHREAFEQAVQTLQRRANGRVGGGASQAKIHRAQA